MKGGVSVYCNISHFSYVNVLFKPCSELLSSFHRSAALANLCWSFELVSLKEATS